MCMVFYLLPISFVAQLVERTAYKAGELGRLPWTWRDTLICVHGILRTAN